MGARQTSNELVPQLLVFSSIPPHPHSLLFFWRWAQVVKGLSVLFFSVYSQVWREVYLYFLVDLYFWFKFVEPSSEVWIKNYIQE